MIVLIHIYLLDQRKVRKNCETRGEIEGKRADVIILGLVEKGTDEITLLSFPRDLLIKTIVQKFRKNKCSIYKK
ncbi:MAG: hypothetical protein Ct9H90mP17_3600 [Actinomycetota bacterium]|nr:MAG: hypothetical protein Ct9H90mP17_3600 [Actinomycetota bacterium]